MILRRPYAFLVRHLRIIHAILLCCSAFLLYKTFGVTSFFGSYIKTSGSVDVSNAANTYVTSWMYISAILIIIFSGVIIYLLNHKKKSILIYLISTIFYLVLLIGFFLLSSFLYDLQFSNADIRLINIIRDAFRFSIVIQIVAIGFFFIRTIGFDLKHFDFKKDVLDLGIDQKDNEEYEFEFRFDKEKAKADINKRVRYFKYFYKENKYIFVFIFCVILIVIFSFFVKILIGREKVYKEGEYFSDDYFNMKIVDCYKTMEESNGNKLSSKKFYIITKVYFQNKTSYEQILKTSWFKLSYGDYDLIEPITRENSKFTEFGVNYYSQTLKPNEERTLNFIYEVPLEYYNDSFTFRYLYDIEYVKNEVQYKYKKIKLSPKEFSEEKENVLTSSLGNEMSFEGSLLGDTKIKIDDIELGDTLYYNLVKCSNSNCEKRRKSLTATTSGNFDLTLMKIHYNIDYDYNALGSKYYNDHFISKFGSFRFEINGKEYNNRLELRDVTPYKTDNYAFVEVRDKLKDADKIYLDFTIRDKVYTYILKDNTVKEE